MNDFYVKCPHTYVALVGYSQGADVAGNVFETSIKDKQKHIIVLLFGDTKFNPLQQTVDKGNYSTKLFGILKQFQFDERLIPTSLIPNVHNYCAKGDPVCNYSKANIGTCVAVLQKCPHLHYIDLGWTAAGSGWLVTRWRQMPKL